MRTKWLAGAVTGIAAIIAVAAVVALGTNGDGGDGNALAIRTQKGLAVAAAANFGAAAGDSESAAARDAATGAVPAPQPDVAMSGGSGVSGSLTGLSMPANRGDVKGGFGYFPAPLLQEGAGGITVQGYGSATAAADSAVVEFYFGSNMYIEPKPVPMPYPDGTEPSPPPMPTPGEVTPITEETLQPVIDAIVAAGVSRGDIEFMGQPYPDPYYSSATLRAAVGDAGSLDAVVTAAQDASSGLDNIMLNSTNVSYTVSDCTALEKAAMKAAVEDASGRGAAFADALGVGLGDVTAASHYSYSPYGGSSCDQAYYGGPYPMGGMPYFEGQGSEVQVFANISVTYAIQ